MDTWNDIYHDLRRNPEDSERVYETAIESAILRPLGWHHSQVRHQEPVQIGTQRIIQDITLYKGDSLQVIIEVKPSHHPINDRDLLQLRSYMRVQNINVGIFIGKDIRVYYWSDSESELHCILSVEFEEDNPSGIDFVNLFSESNFSIEKITEYFHEWKERQERQCRIDFEIENLTSNNTLGDIKTIFKNYLISRNLSEEDAEHVLNHVSINITRLENRSIINRSYNFNTADYQEETAPTIRQRRSPSKRIKVKFPDGRTIIPEQAYQALIEVVKFAGPHIVQSLNIRRDGENIISTNEHRNPLAKSKHIGNSYFVNTHSSSEGKYNMIKTISDRLNLNIQVDLI